MAQRKKRGATRAARDENGDPTHGIVYVYPRDIRKGEVDDELKLGAAWKSSPQSCRKDYARRHGLLDWLSRKQTSYAVSAKTKKELIECERRCAKNLEEAGAHRTGGNLGRRETFKGIPYKKAKPIFRETVLEFNRERKASKGG